MGGGGGGETRWKGKLKAQHSHQKHISIAIVTKKQLRTERHTNVAKTTFNRRETLFLHK